MSRLAPVPGKQRRKQIQAGRSGRTEPNAADCSARDLLHPFMGAVDGAQDTACLFQEDFTSDGQRDAAGTIQELGADFSTSSRAIGKRPVGKDCTGLRPGEWRSSATATKVRNCRSSIRRVYQTDSIVSLDESHSSIYIRHRRQHEERHREADNESTVTKETPCLR